MLDYFYREVDPEIWIIPAPLAIALGLASTVHYTQLPLWFPYLFNGVIVGVVALIYYLGFMGGGDLAAVAFTSVALPVIHGSVLPTSLLMILYSGLYLPLYYLGELLRRCGSTCLPRLRARVTGYELVGKYKWWHPLGWRIEGDPHEVVALMNAWDRELDAAPLLPQVTLLFLGLLTAVIVGDAPILALLGG